MYLQAAQSHDKTLLSGLPGRGLHLHALWPMGMYPRLVETPLVLLFMAMRLCHTHRQLFQLEDNELPVVALAVGIYDHGPEWLLMII